MRIPCHVALAMRRRETRKRLLQRLGKQGLAVAPLWYCLTSDRQRHPSMPFQRHAWRHRRHCAGSAEKWSVGWLALGTNWRARSHDEAAKISGGARDSGDSEAAPCGQGVSSVSRKWSIGGCELETGFVPDWVPFCFQCHLHEVRQTCAGCQHLRFARRTAPDRRFVQRITQLTAFAPKRASHYHV